MAYLLAALTGGFFLFNSLATPQRASRAVESALRKRFAGAQVRADLRGKRGRDVLGGRFQSAHVEMSGFTFGQGLQLQVVPSAKNMGRVGLELSDFGWHGFHIAQAQMSLDNLLLDWKALRKGSQLKLVSSSDPGVPRTQGRLRLVLGQDALQAWVREKYPELENVRVALASDRGIRVKGTRALLGAALPFEMSGHLELSRGRVLEVRDPLVSAGGAPLSGPLATTFTRGLSSLFEIDPNGTWPLAISQTSLKVQEEAGAPALVLEAAIALKPVAQIKPAELKPAELKPAPERNPT